MYVFRYGGKLGSRELCDQGFESLDQKVVVTVKGANTIREFCKPRNRPDLKKYLTQCLNKEDQENVKLNVQVLTRITSVDAISQT